MEIAILILLLISIFAVCYLIVSKWNSFISQNKKNKRKERKISRSKTDKK